MMRKPNRYGQIMVGSVVFEDRNSLEEVVGFRKVETWYHDDGTPAGRTTYVKRLGEKRWTLRSHG